jgi:hypothetical protein
MGWQLYRSGKVPLPPSEATGESYKLWADAVTDELNTLSQAYHDVRDFGADNTGVNSSNTAAQAALDSTLSNARVHFPSGLYRFSYTSAGIPLLEIKGDNVSITADSATTFLIDEATASGSTPTTRAIEEGQYLFTADGRDNISFIGGTFDGNRTADNSLATDPRAGFFKGVQCDNVSIEHMRFVGCSNEYGGVIRGDSYDGATSGKFRNWRLRGNTVERCAWWTHLRNSWWGVNITDNYLRDMDLDDYSGHSVNDDTAYSRAIRVTGYVNSDYASDGTIGNLVITSNVIEGATYGIEAWNQDSVNGRNPAEAQQVVIANNNVTAIYGIGVNSWGNVSITGNTVRRFTKADGDAYSGNTRISSTSGQFGAGIEARPGYGFTVVGNTLDGSWSSSHPNLAGSGQGIQTGASEENVTCQAVVANNYVSNYWTGLHMREQQGSLFAGNYVTGCRNAASYVTGTNHSTVTWRMQKNTLGNNVFAMRSGTTSHRLVRLAGDEWTVRSNDFIGEETDGAVGTPLLDMPDTSGVSYYITGNTFRYFNSRAVDDDVLQSMYLNNVYDGGLGTDSLAAIKVGRQNNKQFYVSGEAIVNCNVAFYWDNAAGSGESYFAGFLFLHGTNARKINASFDASADTYDLGAATILQDFEGELSLQDMQYLSITSFRTPGGTSSGRTGQINIDGGYVYVCTSTDSWSRATLATF